MIFVTVGTNEATFDRLLAAVARLATDEELVIQHGHSTPLGPPGARLVDFLSFDEMERTMRAARAVVTHAGVGSIMVALASGTRPIVVPRRKSFDEAVDDHQLQLGRRFAAAGLVSLVDDPDALSTVLAAGQDRIGALPSSSALADELRTFIAAAISSPSAALR